jgi:hypothetical protein
MLKKTIKALKVEVYKLPTNTDLRAVLSDALEDAGEYEHKIHRVIINSEVYPYFCPGNTMYTFHWKKFIPFNFHITFDRIHTVYDLWNSYFKTQQLAMYRLVQCLLLPENRRL